MINALTRSSAFYSRREIWFYDGGPYPRASNTLFYQASSLPDGEVEGVEVFTTTSLDLAKSPDAILDGVSKTTRYDIRKGEEFGVETEVFEHPPPSVVETFVSDHREFALDRGLLGIEQERVERLAHAGAFTITRALFEGRIVATHGYVHDETRARLLISYGVQDLENPALRGYANKLLHWEDIKSFRRSGRTVYDFGGIDLEAAAGIARFKLSFGGYTESSHNCAVRTGLYRVLRRSLERRSTTTPQSLG